MEEILTIVSRAPLQHLGQQRHGEAHGGEVVDVHDLRDGFDVQGRDVAPLRDAGVVDQEIDAPEGVHHIDRQSVHGVGIGQVDDPHAAVR